MNREELDERLKPFYSEMETRGIRYDRNKAIENYALVKAEKELVIKEIRILTSSPKLNPNSTKQIGPILVEMGYKIPKTPTGNYSVKKDVLTRLKPSTLVDNLLKLKDIASKAKVYKSLLDFIDGATYSERFERITFKFMPDSASGRICTEKHNLQNISKEVRYCLLPEEGCKLVAFDFKSQESVLLAAMAGDEEYIKAYESGFDIHSWVARKIFASKYAPDAEVLKEDRTRAKAVTYGLAYGQTEFGLAHKLRITKQEASDIINLYYSAFPKIKSYIDAMNNSIPQQGFSDTYLGSRYIFNKTFFDQDAELRRAFNASVQGGGADCLRQSLFQFMVWREAQSISSDFAPHVTVYDSLIISIKMNSLSLLDEISNQVLPVKINPPGGCPATIKIDYKIGDTWGEITD